MNKQLPKNWVECKLGDILSLKNGYAFKSNDFIDEGIPVIRISNIQDGNIELDKTVKINKEFIKQDYIVQNGDILIAMSGATTGKYGMYNNDDIALQNQRVGNLKPHSLEYSNKKYIYYLLGSLKKEVEDRAYGGAQPNISPKLIESITIGLPPLPEQNRIVEKLDNLFNQLKIIKKSMANIPLLLKDFRQQILTQAVTGKLTEEWRKGKELEETIDTTIGKLFDVKTGSTPKRGTAKYYDNAKIPWLKSGQVRNEFIYEADEFITEIAVKETNAKIYPIDTILVAMYGEGKTRGQVGWMKIEAASNQAIAALVNEEMKLVTRKYVYNFCLSQYNEIRAQAEGGNQPNLNLSKIKNWIIKLPSDKEQQEIVIRIERLFAKADAIEQQYKSLKQKIDTLPQALLHKAFKGELSEQLDSDGDAKGLLKEIETMKNSIIKSKKK